MAFSSNDMIGVCGAGAMGAGIAQIASQAGHKVLVLDTNDEALARGRKSIEKGAAALLKRGKLDEVEAQALKERISWTLDASDLSQCRLVIEAIVENASIKHKLFETLESVLSEDAVIATNTSSLSVTDLAESLHRPARFIGLHFFNPAPVMKLVEVVSGKASDPAIIDAAMALMKNWGKVAVNARDVPGFIVNRVARPYYSEGWRAYEEGAAEAATIDFLYRELAGFRMGPLELGDFIGHDINYEAARSIYKAYDRNTRFTPSTAQHELMATGKLGRKSGAGVYQYGGADEKQSPVFENTSDFKPESIVVSTRDGKLASLLDRAGVSFEVDQNNSTHEFALVDGVEITFTNGASAKKLSASKPQVVLEWMSDPASANVLAFAVSDERAREAALKLAAVCGKQAILLKDRPGLVVFRTLAQLANCAADAVRDEVADAESIDQAMKFGVNYPFGPLAWAVETGMESVVHSLRNIAEETGDTMYQPSEYLLSESGND